MNKNTTQTIGLRIKNSRQKIGLSQSEVSKMMHLSRGVCGQWERGIANPSTAHLSRLAQILETPFEYLATGNTSKIKIDYLSSIDQKKVYKAKMNILFNDLSTLQQKNIINLLESII